VNLESEYKQMVNKQLTKISLLDIANYNSCFIFRRYQQQQITSWDKGIRPNDILLFSPP